MKSTKLTLLIASLLVLFLMTLAVFELVSVRAKSEETSRLLTLVEQAEEEQALVQSVRILRNKAEEDVKLFEEIVLTDSNLVPVIETIERAGRAIGLSVEIESVDIANGAEGEPNSVKFDIKGKGSWEDNLSFLSAIESLPQRVMVENASLYQEVGVWHTDLSIVLYSFN